MITESTYKGASFIANPLFVRIGVAMIGVRVSGYIPFFLHGTFNRFRIAGKQLDPLTIGAMFTTSSGEANRPFLCFTIIAATMSGFSAMGSHFNLDRAADFAGYVWMD